jgi:hypothetical protein
MFFKIFTGKTNFSGDFLFTINRQKKHRFLTQTTTLAKVIHLANILNLEKHGRLGKISVPHKKNNGPIQKITILLLYDSFLYLECDW